MKHYDYNGVFYIAKDGYIFTKPNTYTQMKNLMLGPYDSIDNYLIDIIAEDWQIDREYFSPEVCKYNGKVYKCIFNHISTEEITPDNENYWVEQ